VRARSENDGSGTFGPAVGAGPACFLELEEDDEEAIPEVYQPKEAVVRVPSWSLVAFVV
jgi:hypothetical protein